MMPATRNRLRRYKPLFLARFRRSRSAPMCSGRGWLLLSYFCLIFPCLSGRNGFTVFSLFNSELRCPFSVVTLGNRGEIFYAVLTLFFCCLTVWAGLMPLMKVWA